MDLTLTDEQIDFRREVRGFIEHVLTDDMRRGAVETVGPYPPLEPARAWQQVLARRGWAAPAWPAEFGGPGFSAIERFILESECAIAGAPQVYPIGIRLFAPVLMRFGTPEQQARWLPRILTDEDHWCQGFSEPSAGSDLAALATRAVREGDHFRVNGTKLWTTHAHHADWMFALVRTSVEPHRRDGISMLAIDMRSPGVEVHPIISIGGDHDVNQVFLSDVIVPADCLIGPEGQGWACAKYLLEFERGTGLFSGRLRAALMRVEDILCAEGGNDGAYPRIAAVGAQIDVFEMLELKTLGVLPQNTAPGPISSVLKLRSSRIKQAIAQLAFDLLGEEALVRDETLKGLLVTDYLNSRAASIFGGTSEIQLGIIARALVPHQGQSAGA